MKRKNRLFIPTLAIASFLFLVACEWESGSDNDFNTSQNVDDSNISNLYTGIFPNGRAVERTSGPGSIFNFVIQQSGRNITVTDNRGSTYEGTVGRRTVTRDNVDEQRNNLLIRINSSAGGEEDSNSSSGQRDIVFQVSFGGRDEVAGKEIEFTGVVQINSTVTLIPISTTDPDTLTTSTEIFEDTTSLSSLAGTWIEKGGVVSEVAAQVRSNQERVQQIPLPTPTPTPTPTPAP